MASATQHITVGNLVQYLQFLEKEGLTRQEILDKLRLFHGRMLRSLPRWHVKSNTGLRLKNAGSVGAELRYLAT